MSAIPDTSAFDFDRRIDRRNTHASKWQKYAGRDILPFWVADMEFETAPSVKAAVRARAEHGIYGYTTTPDSLVEAAIEWLARDYGWEVHADWIEWLPAVVGGFNLACRAVGEPGDTVMMNVPVYHPFLSAPGNQERRPCYVPLAGAEHRWEMDFDAMTAALDARTGLFLQCNPQNPTGRVYTEQELRALAAFAEQHDIVICSDEIHCGLVIDPASRHVPIAALDASIATRTITLMAPTKTFNIPGLGCGFAVIPDAHLRTRFHDARRGLVPGISPFAYAAAEAALRDDGRWQRALLDYLAGNHAELHARVNAMPAVSCNAVEGTYLAWIDMRELQLDDPALWLEQRGLGLSNGADFGGPGFVRFNFGCPRGLMHEGLDRFERALADR